MLIFPVILDCFPRNVSLVYLPSTKTKKNYFPTALKLSFKVTASAYAN